MRSYSNVRAAQCAKIKDGGSVNASGSFSQVTGNKPAEVLRHRNAKSHYTCTNPVRAAGFEWNRQQTSAVDASSETVSRASRVCHLRFNLEKFAHPRRTSKVSAFRTAKLSGFHFDNICAIA